jgi:hypothetical protein
LQRKRRKANRKSSKTPITPPMTPPTTLVVLMPVPSDDLVFPVADAVESVTVADALAGEPVLELNNETDDGVREVDVEDDVMLVEDDEVEEVDEVKSDPS